VKRGHVTRLPVQCQRCLATHVEDSEPSWNMEFKPRPITIYA
jgi:hypothetical protein